MKALEELVGILARLPGIGRKSAARIAFHILKSDDQYVALLADKIGSLKERVRFCSVCGSYTEEDPCAVCSSPARDRTVICVVEQAQDVLTIEASREYRGVYHVLGALISPLDGIGPDALRLDRLAARVRGQAATEVVIATNPTVEGDTTALYIKKYLDGTGARVTRLATGIPVGGDLEYADRLTLARSFRGRVAL
ncbi:MAG: recombination protein RecR [Spirochaetae bacterium HGW-Spirochaetae-3]|nr:MAG: recombination protein RecR [Spirochaetae bacterium HGW-Spirochaetae-3]